MIQYWVGLLCLLGALLVGTGAQCDECPTGDAAKENVEATVNCLVGAARKHHEQRESTEDSIRSVVALWDQRDGAGGFPISDALLALVEIDPRSFFNVMLEHGNSFSDWVANLDRLSFTWFKAPPSPLGVRRRRLIRLLEDTKELDPKQDALRRRLIVTLKTVKPRLID